ncbi:phosphoglycerol transferase MdoB-like AlkP superfamily enzyme [Bisgaardia hudsonensis]|uniref:Phosphoglycerol transferase MdoB-like AlkP superfamily enzyme n=1 Tax=Bisgaardia hudsonensis TaxID=109472 RepID=A0A4R2N2I2_9PAST|nr:LTA synthase family protein [Bisgaardia hudsonensis]TCP14019.1 phosphoglycerol transferase MdoB-like AlkP superfamily enzyme [Bisgaardia hudsonensis]
MIHHFISQNILRSPEYTNSIKRMRLLGARFDIKVISSMLILPYLISFLLSSFLSSNNISVYFYSISIFIISFICIAFTVGNYFYYKTYNTYYDVFIFGFFEDDTEAVLKNIYDDYPIFKSILIVLILSIIPSVISFLLLKDIKVETTLAAYTLLFITLILMILALRGTINSKPLGKIHAQVSSLNTINYMVPNGPIAVTWAIKERKKSIQFSPVEKERGEILIQNLFSRNSLIYQTEQNSYLEENLPHVVFSLMESFGHNILYMDNPDKNDLLGELRTHFNEDFVFKNFTSFDNGTASSLLGQCFYSTNENLSQSSEQKTLLPHTAFKPYKEKGYRIIFITSGNAMWRSLANYLPYQGVDEIYDQNNIIDIYPESQNTLSYWGVADEYSFKLAKKLLDESKQPLFIYILTITNHPPYKAPHGYKVKTIDSSCLIGKIGKDDTERKNILSAYQYATDALGNFITNIKNSSLKEKTIIGASGDHHLRGMKQTLPQETFLSYSVPFYLYVPKTILENTPTHFDRSRFGSHKDIMPTLYSISLSNAEYWAIGGRNLLLQKDIPQYNFSYNRLIWADKSGVVDISKTPFTKYSWDKSYLVAKNEIPMTKKEIQTINDYIELLNWQMNFLLKGYKNP